MSTVHLSVVELKRYSQISFEELPAVSAPYHERIVIYAAIHSYSSVYIILSQCRGADYHAVCNIMTLTLFGHLTRQPQIVGVESGKVTDIWDIA